MKIFLRKALIVFVLALLSAAMLNKLHYYSISSILSDQVITDNRFRKQPVNKATEQFLSELEDPGTFLALYWAETKFETEAAMNPYELSLVKIRYWQNVKGWSAYVSACRAIWDDLSYFPVPVSLTYPSLTVSFENSWMFERSYGGERRHEGTDIMPSQNETGIYPVISMTDGTVTSRGWLELGGFRIGITAPGGAYFYYAHLQSYADIRPGDKISAGDFIGYMGDTGYGKKEGTSGKFPVHLHIGIYLNSDGKEISVNPYPVLKYLESRKTSAEYG